MRREKLAERTRFAAEVARRYKRRKRTKEWFSVTATFRKRDTGELATQGAYSERGVYDALRQCAADFTPDAYRLVSVSTPETIYRDLQGARPGQIGLPENTMAGAAGLGAFRRG